MKSLIELLSPSEAGSQSLEQNLLEFEVLLETQQDEQKRRRQINNKLDSFYPETGSLRRELYPKHCKFRGDDLRITEITWLSRRMSTWFKLLGLGCCLLAFGARAVDRAHTLNIFAWSDYFPESVTARFQIGRAHV